MEKGAILLMGLASLVIIIALVIYVFILQSKLSKLQDKQFKNLYDQKNLPLESKVKTMVKNGQKDVEIIKFLRQEENLGMVQAKQYLDRIKSS